MSRHSKNNTALSFFTYAEKQRLNYGTQKERFGKDSMREFAACYLCLQPARSPMCCTLGHIACRECLISSILLQRKAINAEIKSTTINAALEASEEACQEHQKEERRLRDFERSQTSVLKEGSTATNADSAMKNLSCVWIPSLTPTAKPIRKTKPERTRAICTATERGHPVNLKACIELVFERSKDSENYICPLCTKEFRNGIKAALSRRCGHVVCKRCLEADKTACLVCDKRMREHDIIELVTDGTGFASGGGKVSGEKWNVAFQ